MLTNLWDQINQTGLSVTGERTAEIKSYDETTGEIECSCELVE